MATEILPPSTAKEADRYQLSEEHRQAILAQSDSSLLLAEIERKRVEFIRLYGTEFGTGCARND